MNEWEWMKTVVEDHVVLEGVGARGGHLKWMFLNEWIRMDEWELMNKNEWKQLLKIMLFWRGLAQEVATWNECY